MTIPSAQDFISVARARLAALTDSADGTQMHARAVAGKRLIVHVHGWDRWANAGAGARCVSLRVEGQYIDRAICAWATTPAAEAFAAELQAALKMRA